MWEMLQGVKGQAARIGRAVQASQVGSKGFPINTHQQTASRG